MSFETWLILSIRASLILVAGEVAIRYLGWLTVVVRRREAAVIWPILASVAGYAVCVFGNETGVMIARTSAAEMQRPELLLGYHFAEACRIGEVFFASTLTYPVTKLQYNHSLERALLEMTVRVFLIATSIFIGWKLCTIFSCLARHVC